VSNYGFGHLKLSVRDLVRFGSLYADSGPEVISRDYRIQAMTAAADGGAPEDLPYGLLWWAGGVPGLTSALAAGWAGQFLLVVPERRLVIAGTGDPGRLRHGWQNARHLASEIAAA
jgi:CubicO group peptidase (beta-lactamase class C family)